LVIRPAVRTGRSLAESFTVGRITGRDLYR
jgi:hypothetical protein